MESPYQYYEMGNRDYFYYLTAMLNILGTKIAATSAENFAHSGARQTYERACKKEQELLNDFWENAPKNLKILAYRLDEMRKATDNEVIFDNLNQIAQLSEEKFRIFLELVKLPELSDILNNLQQDSTSNECKRKHIKPIQR